MWVNGYWNVTGECTCHHPNNLPPGLITGIQILGAIWQIDTQLWFAPLITVLIWVWDLVDFALDWLFYGIFIWCKPIAYVFIWIINVVQSPLNLFGWINEFLSGMHKLPLEFWMWIFGDGCFLMWGKNCWTDMTFEYRSPMTAMDISIFAKSVEMPSATDHPSTPKWSPGSNWSQNFFQRFSFDNIEKAINEFNYEAEATKLMDERMKDRTQRLHARQSYFDETDLG